MKLLLALTAAVLLAALAVLPPAGGRLEAQSGAPEQVPQQGRGRVPSACGAVVSETVSADAFGVCETTDVTVTADVTCPAGLPLHVVFVVAKHLLMEDHLATVKREAAAAANSLDTKHGAMAGLVTLSAQERREVELTRDKGRVVSAISGINLDRIDPRINEIDWLGAAQRMLEGAHSDYPDRSPIDVIVLYTTGCPTGLDAYCQRLVASAGRVKSTGTTVIGVCNPAARPFGIPLPGDHCRWIRQMATNPYYYDLRAATRVRSDFTALQAEGEKLTLKRVALVDVLGRSLLFVSGLADPQPGVREQELTWSWRNVAPGARLTATYRITPTTTGVLDLRQPASRVELTDSLDRLARPVPIPQRPLTVSECLPQMPTATDAPEPSATATVQPTATAEPTATPAPTGSPTPTSPAAPVTHLAYLPIALRHVCRAGEVHTDVVLAIDASNSMLEDSGGRTKLARAQEAGRLFVSLLDLRADQAAVVSFSAVARLESPLSGERARLEAAIDGIVASPGTHIHSALELATGELLSERARPGSNAVIVLMTDGRPADGTADAALAAAAVARESGITLYAIGLGDDVDAALLRALATSSDHYLDAAEATDLERIYAEIAGELPCPGGVVWPGARRARSGGSPAGAAAGTIDVTQTGTAPWSFDN